MKCGKAAAPAEEEDGGRIVAELEAAEALAGMARRSAPRRPQHVMEAVVVSQERAVGAEGQCGYAATSITRSEKIVEHIPTQLCSTSQQANPPMKLRLKLTEAEKEERKLRHVMANRESARQTIRRRQAMHLELTRKAADVKEENENLKKHKKLMVEDFNSIKKRNEILRARLAEVMRVSAREREKESSITRAERVCSTTTTPPIFQPPMVPCFWPSMVPSSDVFPSQSATHPHHITSSGGFPFQCATHPHHMMPSQFSMPPGKEHSVPTPFCVVPLPWLLPFLAHANMSGTNTARSCEKCSCSDSRQSEDNNQSLSYQNMMAEAYSQSSSRQTPAGIVVPGLFSPVRRQENLEPSRTCQVQDTPIPAHGSGRNSLFRRNQENPDDLTFAAEARKRRKELMRLKNINCK